MKQEGKTWRFSRKKFYEKLDLFLDQGLDEYIKELSEIEDLDSFQRDKLKALISKPLDIASYMASFYNKTKKKYYANDGFRFLNMFYLKKKHIFS